MRVAASCFNYLRNAEAWPFIAATAALTLLGIYLRVAHLFDAIRFDEATTYVRFVRLPWPYPLVAYDIPNNHILNTILVKIATTAFGPAEWAVRLPNLLAGMGVLALTAIIAGRWFGRTGAVGALAAVAISPPIVHYSVLARGYTLAAFLGLLTLLSVEMRHAGRRGKVWTVVAVLSPALALYAVPTAALFIAPIAAYDIILTAAKKKRAVAEALARWLAAASATALLYLPVVAVNGWRTLLANEYMVRVPVGEMAQFLRLYGRALSDERTWGLGGLLLWAPLAGAGFFAGVARERRFGLLLVLCAGAFLAFFLAGFQLRTRSLNYLFPLIAFGVGALVAKVGTLFRSLTKKSAWPAAAAGVLIVSAAALVQERKDLIDDTWRTGTAPEAEEIATTLRELPTLSRLAVNPWYDDTIEYYLRREGAATAGIDHSAPSAFTFEAYVVVQPESSVSAEIKNFFWGQRIIVHRQTLVREVGDASVWKTTLVNPE